jgi:hypothetical protein
MKRGRPREVVDPVRVSIRVPGDEYDQLDQYSRQSGLSVPKLIRQGAISALKNRQMATTSAQ